MELYPLNVDEGFDSAHGDILTHGLSLRTVKDHDELGQSGIQRLLSAGHSVFFPQEHIGLNARRNCVAAPPAGLPCDGYNWTSQRAEGGVAS